MYSRRVAGLALLVGVTAVTTPVAAQELEPRAYSVSPYAVNFVVFSFSRSDGDIAFDPSLPFEDVSATIRTFGVGYVRSLNVLGRSANIGVSVPILDGVLEGLVFGEPARGTRRGPADARFRFAMNLIGAPAMSASEFASYQQDWTLGFSVVGVAPSGQYDPARLVNIGSNRWAVKPELGVSKRVGRWFLDLYGGVWLFETNDDFVGQTRSQHPIGAGQFHLGYTVRPRLWVALDLNYYTGGRTEIDGIKNFDFQKNSRAGVTVSAPLGRRQSLKASFSMGALTTVGADFNSVAVGYQVLWGAGL